MAAGLPVVGSNFPDLKRYIEGYDIGITCDPTNPGEIANAINYTISDENRYNTMKKNALEAAKIFNWENESKKLVALYKGLSKNS
jgi:glycosyltransferase involved in cell wall biosynthesis